MENTCVTECTICALCLLFWQQSKAIPGEFKNVKVNVHAYNPDIPVSWVDWTVYTPSTGTHSYSLISPGENSAFVHFATAVANHYKLALSFHQVSITAG